MSLLYCGDNLDVLRRYVKVCVDDDNLALFSRS